MLNKKTKNTKQNIAGNDMFNLKAIQLIRYLLDIWLKLFIEAHFIPFIKTSRFGFILWDDNHAACSVILQFKYLVTDLLQYYDRNSTGLPRMNEFCIMNM